MEPIDKAKELMNRFNNEHNSELKYYIIHQSLEESKRCCLILVDELIKSWDKDLYENCGASEYWQEVKKEIIKMNGEIKL